MPHVVIDYSENLGREADIPDLLKKMGAKLGDSGGIIPLGGIRIRAVAQEFFRPDRINLALVSPLRSGKGLTGLVRRR